MNFTQQLHLTKALPNQWTINLKTICQLRLVFIFLRDMTARCRCKDHVIYSRKMK